MRTAIAVFVALTATLAIAAATFVLGMRRKNPLVLNAVRRSGRAMKPLVLRKAGRAGSPTAVVEHVGRTSQRQYQTPVVAAATSDGFVIALPYGQNTECGSGPTRSVAVPVSWQRLIPSKRRVRAGLRRLGVTRGDRVAAYLPNVPETLV